MGRQLFVGLQDKLTKEIKEFRDDLKEFRLDTEWNFKTIMQQTANLCTDMEKTEKRVDQLE